MELEKVAFIVDSSFSASEDYLKKNHMYKVYFGIADSENNDFIDDEKFISQEEILNKFNKGLFFRSNAVSPGSVLELLESLYKTYDKVICFTISSGLSSYYDNILFLLEDNNFKNKLFIVDTKEIGYSEFDLINRCRIMLNNNASIEETLEFAENYYLYSFTMFSCESWIPLSKSGRAPKLLSTIFDKFHTKPIILFFEKNRLGGIARSFQSSVLKIINEFKKTFSFSKNSLIEHVVFYNNYVSESKAEFIRNTLAEKLNINKSDIIEKPAPNLVLIYTGKGSFGINIKSDLKR